jgi:hypothetical protein
MQADNTTAAQLSEEIESHLLFSLTFFVPKKKDVIVIRHFKWIDFRVI